ncbi:TetR/AcrR family transcriptional regulator [Pedomonas sp. V897]|uniref:TetR/AcrR family transcriptional regulator n=1 Tax=Pedomonas sp. V897 TaxID=3446482 RepID=UPI003EDEAA02
MEKGARRRGSVLVEAILDAAWAELIDKGYTSFTLEAVARRAGTSRPVLSRRWPTGADLAVAAIGHYIARHPVTVPDLGSVRAELLLLLRQVSDRGAITITRVLFSMRDYFLETHSSLADLRGELRKRTGGNRGIEDILERGVRRGEIDPARLTPRIATLPLDLVNHEALMTHKPVPEAVIAEIIDSIFLPLVTPEKPAQRKGQTASPTRPS